MNSLARAYQSEQQIKIATGLLGWQAYFYSSFVMLASNLIVIAAKSNYDFLSMKNLAVTATILFLIAPAFRTFFPELIKEMNKTLIAQGSPKPIDELKMPVALFYLFVAIASLIIISIVT